MLNLARIISAKKYLSLVNFDINHYLPQWVTKNRVCFPLEVV